MVYQLAIQTEAIPNSRPKNAPRVRTPDGEGEHKNTKQRAVEERAKLVDDFDQRAKIRREDGHDARENTPNKGRDTADGDIMGVRRFGRE